MSQEDLFTAGESDRWFERNRVALDRIKPDEDLPLLLLELYGVRPASVIEIGASNGFRVAEIRRRYGSKAVAVEPSAVAIADGRRRFPDVEFYQGVASRTGVAGAFDVVIVNYVYHWIDRSNLLATVSETDRLLRDGGVLVLGDFCPIGMKRVRYHHLRDEAVYTYKQLYADVFLASGLYHQVAMLSNSHSGKRLVVDVTDEDRGGAWLLRKSIEGGYVDVELRGSTGDGVGV